MLAALSHTKGLYYGSPFEFSWREGHHYRRQPGCMVRSRTHTPTELADRFHELARDVVDRLEGQLHTAAARVARLHFVRPAAWHLERFDPLPPLALLESELPLVVFECRRAPYTEVEANGRYTHEVYNLDASLLALRDGVLEKHAYIELAYAVKELSARGDLLTKRTAHVRSEERDVLVRSPCLTASERHVKFSALCTRCRMAVRSRSRGTVRWQHPKQTSSVQRRTLTR